ELHGETVGLRLDAAGQPGVFELDRNRWRGVDAQAHGGPVRSADLVSEHQLGVRDVEEFVAEVRTGGPKLPRDLRVEARCDRRRLRVGRWVAAEGRFAQLLAAP